MSKDSLLWGLANCNAAAVSRVVHDTALPKGTLGHQDGFTRSGNVRKVAIVDDDEDLGKLFSIIVSRLGYVTEFVARDGAEIVQAIADGSIRPDLILMDYRMPGMNGLQAARKIVEIRPEQKIIVVTADDKAKEEVVASGFPFVQKPFYIAVISRAIEDAFR